NLARQRNRPHGSNFHKPTLQFEFRRKPKRQISDRVDADAGAASYRRAVNLDPVGFGPFDLGSLTRQQAYVLRKTSYQIRMMATEYRTHVSGAGIDPIILSRVRVLRLLIARAREVLTCAVIEQRINELDNHSHLIRTLPRR